MLDLKVLHSSRMVDNPSGRDLKGVSRRKILVAAGKSTSGRGFNKCKALRSKNSWNIQEQNNPLQRYLTLENQVTPQKMPSDLFKRHDDLFCLLPHLR